MLNEKMSLPFEVFIIEFIKVIVSLLTRMDTLGPNPITGGDRFYIFRRSSDFTYI
jgi:hypothetical protein